MAVKINFSDRLRESMCRHGALFQELKSNVIFLVALGLVFFAFARSSVLLLPPLLSVVLISSILVVALLPSTHRAAKRRKVSMLRDDLLLKNSEILEVLTNSGRNRYNKLHARVSRLSDMLPAESDAVVKPGEYLLWLYLKLLIARNHLEENAAGSSLDELVIERRKVEADMAGDTISEDSRQVKQQTIYLLEQRITAAKMRGIRIEEVESDLLRIEHQLALLCDRAAQQSPLADAGFRIDLATESVTTAICGDLPGGMNVREVEEIFCNHLTT